MSEERSAVLDVRDAWKWFGANEAEAALRAVSVSVRSGELVALAGPSGSGKTTLLSLLGALDRPSRGTVWFDGTDLSRLSDVGLARVRRRFGLVFQDPLLIPRMPLWENVSQPLIPCGVPRAARRERAQAQLTRVGVAQYADRTPETLSGGERHRAALARALIAEPELLIADEPTASLDQDTAGVVIRILMDLARAGRTVIVATHDAQLLASATTTYRLQAGQIIE